MKHTEVKSKEIVAIIPPDLAPGLKLSGVKVMETSSQDDARSRIQELLDEQGAAVLILSDRFYTKLPTNLRERLDEAVLPMLVNLPNQISFEETEEDHRQYVSNLIRRAIGFQIKVT